MITDCVSNCLFYLQVVYFLSPVIVCLLSRISIISVHILVRILFCKIHSNYHYYHQSNFIFALHASVQSRLFVGKALLFP
jgi:hypothetical protein